MASSRLGGALVPFDDGPGGPGGWWILDEPEHHLGDDVLVPDLDCEVLSPSTERIDRGQKLRIYAAAGVAHAWLVNPVEHTLEVLRLGDGAWTIVAVVAGSDTVRLEPFEPIELALGRLWVDAPAASDPSPR